MLKFIKKLLASQQEPQQEEVNLSDLQEWFKATVVKQNHHQYFQEYFNKVKSIKEELNDKLEVLKNHQISEKDKKQVEARVRNIVSGHRDHYARAITRFAEQIQPVQPLENNVFSTLVDFNTGIEFNEKLDNQIEELAKHTAKSYQATQHLFFNQVEPVFKQVGELNLLVKDFNKEMANRKIKKLFHYARSDLSFIKHYLKTDVENIQCSKLLVF